MDNTVTYFLIRHSNIVSLLCSFSKWTVPKEFRHYSQRFKTLPTADSIEQNRSS